MPLSGTVNGSVTQKSSYFSFYFTWSATQNVSGNYSDVTVNTYWKTNNTSYTFDTVGARNASITINGTTSSISKVFSVYWSSNPYLIQTATQRVYHDSNGSKSITISARANGHAASYGPSSSTATSGDCTASASITLNTIPRASSITSAGNVTLGNSCNIKWTPADTSFEYKIKFSLGSWNYTTGYITPNTTSSYTYTGYTIPSANATLLGQMTSTTGTMTATLYTYNSSGTQIGSASSKTFTVTLPSSGDAMPTVGTITLTPQTYKYLMQNKNTVQISVSGCKAGTGSSIKSYTFSGPGISTTTTSTSATSSTISNTGTLTYTVTVTNTRGQTASKTATISCYAWQAPSITLNSYKVATETSSTENNSGKYLRCNYSLSFSSVNNTNDVTVAIYYKKNTESSWSGVTAVSDSTTKSGYYVIKNIDPTITYTVYAVITDNYGGRTESSKTSSFGESRIMNIPSNGNGIAFGKMSETSGVLDSRWPIKSDNPAQTMQNLSYKYYTNSIQSKSSDTVSNWANQGNLATVYYSASDKINNQPRAHGFLLNLTNGPGNTEIHHIWAGQGTGEGTHDLCHRCGNANAYGDWYKILDSYNYTQYTTSAPITLYSTSTGQIGTITLSQSAANFTYLEIFYTDNNQRQPNSVKIYSPNGKYVTLSCVEPSTNGSEPRIYIRSSGWTISGASMTYGRSDLSGANRGVYGQFYPHANGTNIDVKVTENTYIKIFRVLGYK